MPLPILLEGSEKYGAYNLTRISEELFVYF